MALFLPQLKEAGAAVAEGIQGQWTQKTGDAFQSVATSLNIPQAGAEVRSVSSIPDMWARPLAFEMALTHIDSPIRPALVQQWEAMLAAIALADTRSFKLKVELLQIRHYINEDKFARSLYQLLPDPQTALYQLEGERNPWEDIYIFLWNNFAVGITSPTTLICPGEDSDWKGLPWWNQKSGLTDPIPHLNGYEKQQLVAWLNNLREMIMEGQGHDRTKGSIARLCREFAARLSPSNISSGEVESLTLTSRTNFFGTSINRGILSALNQPIQAQPKPSSLQVIPSKDKKPDEDLIIIPDLHQITRTWGKEVQEIWVHGTDNLASLDPNNIHGFNYLREEDVFLPELYFITQAEAFVGALSPTGQDGLRWADKGSITPIIPLNPRLLDYLNSQDIIENMHIEQVSGYKVGFTLIIKLSGVNPIPNGVKDTPKFSLYQLTREYPLKQENAISELPVLEMWPNFRRPGWQHYYGFYYTNSQTFDINFPGATQTNNFPGIGEFHDGPISTSDERSHLVVSQLSAFPDHISCIVKNKDAGIVFLNPPPEIKGAATTTWRVGVDFGTSFTNMYFEKDGSGIAAPLTLSPLVSRVTGSATEVRRPVLREYFIAMDMDLPLSTVLTTRGTQGKANPVLDGRIYFAPALPQFFKAKDDWIRTDLKWEPEKIEHNKLFLKNLLLLISAQAAHANVKAIDWCVSYPSAFSKRDIATYLATWAQLVGGLLGTTGINHNPPLHGLPNVKTESLAVAQFFADFKIPGLTKPLDLVASCCLDIGGGSSDIAIWQEGALIHQCSVRLAGKHIFSQFMEMNPGFLVKKFGEDHDSWNLQGFNFFVKLDSFMSRESEKWLQDSRDKHTGEPEFQGLMQLMALGVGGLYYYIGLILQTLHQEQKYTCGEATPVYLGGNGSRLLHWLADGGTFNNNSPVDDYFTAMLSIASGFDNIGISSCMSSRPKDEVACGLVLGGIKLGGLDAKAADPMIAGEGFEVNGQTYDWNSRMDLKDDDITEISIGELTQLTKFLNSYHQIVKESGLEYFLPPVDGYQVSDNIADNNAFFRPVYRNLKASVLRMRGNRDDIRIEPPFILVLKSLLTVLGDRWADKFKNKG